MMNVVGHIGTMYVTHLSVHKELILDKIKGNLVTQPGQICWQQIATQNLTTDCFLTIIDNLTVDSYQVLSLLHVHV